METNKIWSIIVMLLLSATVMIFTSCGNDDEGDEAIIVKEVVGTWICTESTDIMDDQTITGYMVGKSITISEDKKFSSNSSTIGNGTWGLDGDRFKAKNTYGDTFNATLIVNGNTMKWNGTSSHGVKFNYTWEKKPDPSKIEIKSQDLIGTWDGKDPSGSTDYTMRFICKSANKYELYYVYSSHDALFMSGNYTLIKTNAECKLQLDSKMHDEWGVEKETSVTFKIAWANSTKTALKIGDNTFNKK